MLRIQQNGTETCITALQFICIRFKVYFYFSHALKVINYTAFRSLNLIIEVILTACCHTGRRDITDCTISKMRHKGNDIIVLYLTHFLRTRFQRAFRDYRCIHPHDFIDISKNNLEYRQQMGTKVP